MSAKTRTLEIVDVGFNIAAGIPFLTVINDGVCASVFIS